MALNEQKKSLIEFKRTMDIGADFAEQVAQGADSQYEILRYALGEVGQDGGWQIKQRNIIGETLESVHVEAIEEMLKVMEVKKKAWTTIRKEHVSHRVARTVHPSIGTLRMQMSKVLAPFAGWHLALEEPQRWTGATRPPRCRRGAAGSTEAHEGLYPTRLYYVCACSLEFVHTRRQRPVRLCIYNL